MGFPRLYRACSAGNLESFLTPGMAPQKWLTDPRSLPQGGYRHLRPGRPLRASPQDKPVVVGVASDPEPQHSAGHLDPNCPMVQPDSGRPEPADFLEVQRRVPGIGFQLGECPVGEGLYVGRKRPVMDPETRGHMMRHDEL